MNTFKLILLALSLTILLPGCSEDKTKRKETSNNNDYQKNIGSAVFGGSSEISHIIDDIKVKVVNQPDNRIKEAYNKTVTSKEYILDGDLYELSSNTDGYLGGSLKVKLPLTEKLMKEATKDNVGVIYLSVEGPIFVKGILENGFVVFQTGHLSSWWPTLQTAETQIKSYIQTKSEESVAAVEGKISELAINSVDSLLVKFGDKLGEDFDKKMFSNILKKKGEIDELIKSSAGKKPKEIAEDVNLYMAKIMLDSLPDESKVKFLEKITGNVNIFKKIADSTGTAAGGDYYGAIEILGKTIADEMPLTQKIKSVVNTYQTGIDMWQDHDFNSAFLAYTKGSKPGFFNLRHGIEKKDWAQLTAEYGRAIITQMRIKHPKIYDDEKLLLMAKNQFENREKNESAIKRENEKMTKIYEAWNSESLLKGYVEQYHRKLLSKSFDDKEYAHKYDKAKNFKYFFNTIKHAESELKKIGYSFPVTNRRGRFDTKLKKLLYALTEKGPSGYRDLLNTYRKAYQKDHGIKLIKSAGEEDTSNDTTSTLWDGKWLLKGEFTNSFEIKNGKFVYTPIPRSATTSLIGKINPKTRMASGIITVTRQGKDFASGNKFVTVKVMNITGSAGSHQMGGGYVYKMTKTITLRDASTKVEKKSGRGSWGAKKIPSSK